MARYTGPACRIQRHRDQIEIPPIKTHWIVEYYSR